jgi:hypothetical protein
LPIIPTSAFGLIKDMPKDSCDTANAVQAALRTSRLFDFGKSQIQELIE